MKTNFLFPSKYKLIGWFILIPSILLGAFYLIFEYEPQWLGINLPSFISDGGLGKTNNLIDEIISSFIIIGGILVAFSKEKNEDEFINKIRLESLVWAVIINHSFLIITIIFCYGFVFFDVMIYNLFTLLVLFILKFKWQLIQLKKQITNEELY